MPAANLYPIELQRSLWSMAGMLSICASFVAVSILLLLLPDAAAAPLGNDAVAWFAIVFFGGGGLFMAFRLWLAPRAAVRLTRTGLALPQCFSQDIPWTGIETVELRGNVVLGRRIRLVLTDAYVHEHMTRGPIKIRRFDLPQSLSGISAKRLYEMIRAAHDTFRASRGGSSE